MTVLGELSRIVSSYKLMEISECEQELVCGSDHGRSLQVRLNILIYFLSGTQNKKKSFHVVMTLKATESDRELILEVCPPQSFAKLTLKPQYDCVFDALFLYLRF